MLVPMNWLREYIDPALPVEVLAEKLTRAGIAVENIRRQDTGLDKVVVGLVRAVEKHPGAERLWVCRVDPGTGELPVVTGAENVRPGQKVPVALVGASLPNGLVIREAEIRSVRSAGMLCSAAELALDEKTVAPEDRQGILVLPPDAVVGQPVAVALGLADPVMELELTPNRADCLAVVNVAREVAAITGQPLTLPVVTVREEGTGMTGNQVKVTIEDGELCSRYAARLFTDLQPGPSPAWMQQRLRSAGMRPINNIVDITNYVMLEWGHPLHAFDCDTVKDGHIIVRRARKGEKLVTLDGQERELNPENLVIADPEKAIALAGVMGGAATEITPDTRVILLEAAHFQPASVRRTARQVGLRSEASQRFEKGVNIATVTLAMDRVAQLIEQLGVAKVVPGYVDVYRRQWQPERIPFRVSRINALLGTALPSGEMANLFQRLGFKVTWDAGEPGETGVVVAPTYRADLTGEHDLAEEVARLYGYDRIPTTLPVGRTTHGQRTWPQLCREKIVNTLVGCGLREVITFSFINPRHLDRLGLFSGEQKDKVVPVFNPLSEEQGVLRPTILPGLLEVAARNENRRVADVAVFELGATFQAKALPLNELPVEKWRVAVLVTGRGPGHWQRPSLDYDFYYLKGVAEKLFTVLKINGVAWEPSVAYPFLHPGRAARVSAGNGAFLGYVGEMHPAVVEAYGLAGRPVVMELDVRCLIALAQAKADYKPLPRFPSTDRDMAMLLPDTVPAGRVDQVIAAVGGELVERWRLFDVYKGVQIPAGFHSLAYTIRYQAADRTLTDEEVNAAHEAIKQALATMLGAEFR
ncbi:MAG: phenylalanine--tRNA ligase subunit beta [Heliobacteriaceae bacterium]|nr:phenylalanine--tRNA ligase subunit beta [Heliobacteriaceae bacterium]